MDMVIVTDFEKVELDDFYLSNEWGDEKQRIKLKEMVREGSLFVGYEVEAINYLIFSQMDACQVFISGDGEILLRCEVVAIGNEHNKVFPSENY